MKHKYIHLSISRKWLYCVWWKADVLFYACVFGSIIILKNVKKASEINLKRKERMKRARMNNTQTTRRFNVQHFEPPFINRRDLMCVCVPWKRIFIKSNVLLPHLFVMRNVCICACNEHKHTLNTKHFFGAYFFKNEYIYNIWKKSASVLVCVRIMHHLLTKNLMDFWCFSFLLASSSSSFRLRQNTLALFYCWRLLHLTTISHISSYLHTST